MDFAAYREKVEHFQAKYLFDGCRVLDLGCGPGNNARLLLAKHPATLLTGIDFSEEMVHLARKHVPDGVFSVGNICDFRAGEMIDAVLASFCIVHITPKQTKRLIAEISRSLEVGGYLYLSFMEGQGAGYETTSYSNQEIFFQYYNRDDMTALLQSENLATVELVDDEYHEEDGNITTDIFIIARKTT